MLEPSPSNIFLEITGFDGIHDKTLNFLKCNIFVFGAMVQMPESGGTFNNMYVKYMYLHDYTCVYKLNAISMYTFTLCIYNKRKDM